LSIRTLATSKRVDIRVLQQRQDLGRMGYLESGAHLEITWYRKRLEQNMEIKDSEETKENTKPLPTP
jgi:hypothetical protein